MGEEKSELDDLAMITDEMDSVDVVGVNTSMEQIGALFFTVGALLGEIPGLQVFKVVPLISMMLYSIPNTIGKMNLERRLTKIENSISNLEISMSSVKENFESFDEHNYVYFRNTLHYYLVSMEPDMTATIAQLVAEYIAQPEDRKNTERILNTFEQFTLDDYVLLMKIDDYLNEHKTDVIEWEAFLTDQGTPFIGSRLLTEKESLDSVFSDVEFIPASIEKLRNIGVLNVYYPLFPGGVNLDEIGSFKLTRLGYKLRSSIKRR